MRARLLAVVLALCLPCAAQNRGLTIAQLNQFLDSETQFHHPDKQVAAFLKQTRLSERLDDTTLESWAGQFHLGPQTVAALRQLRDRSQSLPAPPPRAIPEAIPSRPAPSPEEQKAILNDVQNYALAYSANLPDFLCIEKEIRWQARQSAEPDWRQVDELDKRLTYFEQKEDYKPFLYNNRPVAGRDLKSFGGAQSFGDFGSMLRQIFEPSSHAEFTFEKWNRLRGRYTTLVFRFRVALENSRYQIFTDNGRFITTAYHGTVQVEAESHKVLQVSVVAEDIPPDFPVQSASDVLDYDYQEISGRQFLLPLEARIVMTGEGMMSRNEKHFVGYNKYSADTSVTFDLPKTDCTDPKNKTLKECTGHP